MGINRSANWELIRARFTLRLLAMMNMVFGLIGHHFLSQFSKMVNQMEKSIDASILIPWGYIASIVHFPGEEGFDFPDPFATNLGFNINNE